MQALPRKVEVVGWMEDQWWRTITVRMSEAIPSNTNTWRQHGRHEGEGTI